MELKKVTEKDFRFLYNLLRERTSEVNISHKRMPTWAEHIEFNKAEPYKQDYIIQDGSKKVGRIYLSHNNEIGIFIKKKYQKQGYGKKALEMFLSRIKERKVYANISPKNFRGQRFFKKQGFKLIQYTYVKDLS